MLFSHPLLRCGGGVEAGQPPLLRWEDNPEGLPPLGAHTFCNFYTLQYVYITDIAVVMRYTVRGIYSPSLYIFWVSVVLPVC